MVIKETTVSSRLLEVEPLNITEEEFLGKLLLGRLQIECNHFYDIDNNRVIGKIGNLGEFKSKKTFTYEE